MKPEVCFEVSFECGNKVGGIYTILRSKTKEMKKRYGNNYYAIGFFNPRTYINDFSPEDAPEEIKRIFLKLEKKGIKCMFGRWISGNDVNLILVDSNQFRKEHVNEIKKKLWEDYRIDSLRAGFDYDEPVAWSTAVGMLIEEFMKLKRFKNKNTVAHFHEWLSGPGLLYLRKRRVPVALVFTTHATRIGRAKSSYGENLMEEVMEGLKKGKYFNDEQAKKYGLEAQHGVEMNSAKYADVFTTVSDVVKDEAKYILKREPEIVVPNALNFSKFYSSRTLTILHEKNRNKINEFLEAYFSPYYPIDVKNNIVIFISGRYEFLNKGIDLFILALKLLNERLVKRKCKKTVFVFLLIPSGIKEPKESVLQSMIQYQKMKDLVEERFSEVVDDVVSKTLSGEVINFRRILGKEFFLRVRIISHFFSKFRGKNAPLCAYELNYDEGSDKILTFLKENGLVNKPEDKVKVIFYPTYLSPSDGLLGMEYQDFVIGASMGVFPSRYEPWGYTPFETAALRTLSVTTDLSGFGRFIQKNAKKDEKTAIKVLHLMKNSIEDVVKELADIMEECVYLGIEERMRAKLETRRSVEMLDWRIQVVNYFKAHELALENMRKRLKHE